MDSIRNRIKMAVDTLGELRYSQRKTIENIRISDGDYDFAEHIPEGKFEKMEWRPFGRDETWGGSDRHYWFAADALPGRDFPEIRGKEVRVIVSTGDTDLWNTDNPQIMAYIDGRFKGTMDMNHQEMILTEGQADRGYRLAFYAYSNNKRKTNFFHVDTAVYEKDVADLYYDMKVPFEAAEMLTEDDMERIETWKVLNDSIRLLDLRRPGCAEFHESVQAARVYLHQHYYEPRKAMPENGQPNDGVTVHSIGHTHIDVAWKWPLRQTRQKAVRSFNTVLRLMERFPEYKFMSSQPQLYQFVKEEAPELFEEIKARIKEGRWEAEGAMWLEPDCNLSSGESLIRHILYGRRFFEKELGAEPNEVLWLPDVFGYSAALPQILKKSGIPYFMTTKIGWNEYNQFPYDTFTWQGIDGSEVLAYLITTKDYRETDTKKRNESFNTTYNGRQNARQIMGTWQRYQNKELSRDVLTCYGHGDGGGGPMEEMLEESRRMECGVARCPRTRQTFVKEFFHLLEERMDRRYLPKWSGELYLEFHRGTYTSMAKNKWYNRKSEFLCGDAEFYSVLAMEKNHGFLYPKAEMEKNWKLLLLNQFHDILPGSSIKDVYEDSAVQYEEILASGRELVKQAKEAIVRSSGMEPEGRSLMAWNSLSFSRTGILKMDRKPEGMDESAAAETGILMQQAADGSYLYLLNEVPAKGYRVYGPCRKETAARQKDRLQAGTGKIMEEILLDESGNPSKIRTPYYQITFNSKGELVQIYDRREERELVKPGFAGNHISIFEDRPLEYDAWNIDATYEEHSWEFDAPEIFEILENGPVRGCVHVKRRFMDSWLEQYIYFYGHTARIDFKTEMDWHEHQMLVKTAFPLDILCDSADYEIQFGNVKRPTHYNTSWDKARFETCGHKWADMSENGYGAALLNDCKYGYDIHDSVMRLTLLKSGIFPNPDADQGRHTFTYALFPHRGDFRKGRVIQEAYELNCPLTGNWVGTGMETAGQENETESSPKVSCSYLTIQEENVFADTVKQAEEEDGIIIRLYEAYGKRTKAHVLLPWKGGKTAVECGCMEDELEPVKFEQGVLELEMRPYEIKTVKMKDRKQQ